MASRWRERVAPVGEADVAGVALDGAVQLRAGRRGTAHRLGAASRTCGPLPSTHVRVLCALRCAVSGRHRLGGQGVVGGDVVVRHAEQRQGQRADHPGAVLAGHAVHHHRRPFAVGDQRRGSRRARRARPRRSSGSGRPASARGRCPARARPTPSPGARSCGGGSPGPRSVGTRPCRSTSNGRRRSMTVRTPRAANASRSSPVRPCRESERNSRRQRTVRPSRPG